MEAKIEFSLTVVTTSDQVLDRDDARATKRSMFDKMGLRGLIAYKARIRPIQKSYLHLNSDGSIVVAPSGRFAAAEYTFLFILQANSVPSSWEIQSVSNEDFYITGHPESGTVDGNTVSGSNNLSVWYKKDLNDCSQLYLKDPDSGEDLYLCIEDDDLHLTLKKESSLLDNEAMFVVETII